MPTWAAPSSRSASLVRVAARAADTGPSFRPGSVLATCFCNGFAKSDKANITQDEKKALQFAGRVFLDLSTADLTKALQAGVHLVEVRCAQQTH